MPNDLRRYLLERFTTDAATLRQRAATLKRESQGSQGKGNGAPGGKPSKGQPVQRTAGPDAATSLRMAEACDDVVRLLDTLPARGDLAALLSALMLAAPELDARAAAAAKDPMVRSVYAGAATRVRELIKAESHDDGVASDDNDLDSDAEDEDEGEDDVR